MLRIDLCPSFYSVPHPTRGAGIAVIYSILLSSYMNCNSTSAFCTRTCKEGIALIRESREESNLSFTAFQESKFRIQTTFFFARLRQRS